MCSSLWRACWAAKRLPPNALTAVAVAALGLGGCNDLASVDAPDVVQPIDYETPAGATALAAGAITQFHWAFGGPFDTQVRASGLIADELLTTALNRPEEWEWDSRDSDPSTSGGPYNGLHEARQRLLTAIGSLQRVAPDSSARIGQLFALLGYTSIFFGENYCAGVPLSGRDAALRPVYRESLTTTQLFDSALVAFDSALVYGIDSARIVNLARVGRGRALLNQGRFSDAAEAVASVPTEYVYQVTYLNATSAPWNGLAFSHSGGGPETGVTVPEQEGGNGLNWRTANDPRVPVIRHSPMIVGGSELWLFAPYETLDAPVPLAGGLEARLIEAEAALQVGDAGTWLAIHNTLRTTLPGLESLADPGTTVGRVDLHFRERAFWLFLTGHRHGDLRRLVRQYGRDAEAVFPSGVWREGVVYGPATNMAPPTAELNNPHYNGCLSRDA